MMENMLLAHQSKMGILSS